VPIVFCLARPRSEKKKEGGKNKEKKDEFPLPDLRALPAFIFSGVAKEKRKERGECQLKWDLALSLGKKEGGGRKESRQQGSAICEPEGAPGLLGHHQKVNWKTKERKKRGDRTTPLDVRILRKEHHENRPL